MSEKSYFHNGTAVGHATEAPYNQELFAGIINTTHALDGAFVLPDKLNNLEVSAGAGRSLNVATGQALIYGYWYENDAIVNLTQAQNTSNHNRIDAVVAEVDTETGTGTLKIIQGVSGALPSLPPTNTCDTLKQCLLAYYVATPAFAAASDNYVLDQRQFLVNAYHRNTYSTQNDFPNGMFVGWGDSENTGSSRRAMPGWYWNGVGAAYSVKDAERFEDMPYGRCAQIYAEPDTVTEGFRFGIFASTIARTLTFSMLLQVNEGEVRIDFAGTYKYYPAMDGVWQVIIRASASGEEYVQIDAYSGADTKFGDLRLAQGLAVAERDTDFPQLIMFDAPTFLNRDGGQSFAGLSTGNTQVYLYMLGHTEDFYSTAWEMPVKALVLWVGMNDSGSAAGNAFAYIGFYNGATGPYNIYASAAGLTNDTSGFCVGWLDQVTSNYYTNMHIIATGAGTTDVELACVGVII